MSNPTQGNTLLNAFAALDWPEETLAQLLRHLPQIADSMKERARQDNKFGPQNRPPVEWFLILSEEVGEVAKECVEIQFNDEAHPFANLANYRKELVEVVAVGLAALLNFDMREKMGEWHKGLPIVAPYSIEGGIKTSPLPARLVKEIQRIRPEVERDSKSNVPHVAHLANKVLSSVMLAELAIERGDLDEMQKQLKTLSEYVTENGVSAEWLGDELKRNSGGLG